MIVVVNVLRRGPAGLTGTFVVLKVDFLLFIASPKSFCEDIIHAPPPSVHADLYVAGLRPDPVDVLTAGVLAALVAVDYHWTSRPEGVLKSFHYEAGGERVREGPGDYVAGVPVQEYR